MQNEDGSFNIAGKLDLFLSIHAAHAVARVFAKKKNGVQIFKVPEPLLSRYKFKLFYSASTILIM